MTLSECKKIMRAYQAVSESGNVPFNWRTTARWSLRHQWAQEENGKLRDALRHATERAGEVDACHDIMAECRKIAGDPHTSTVDAVRGLLARAEAAEAKLAQCQAWRQEEANNLNHCIRAKQKAEAALTQLDAPCMWIWDEAGQAWEPQCDGWLFPEYYEGDWPRCPRCGHPVKRNPNEANNG